MSIAALLSACDRALGEVGRRKHLFAWLKAPGGGPEDWLPVDAYYPGHRLIVVCERDSDPHQRLYAELAPAHGLRFLELDAARLRADPEGAERALQRLISDLDLAPRRIPGSPGGDGTPARAEPVAGRPRAGPRSWPASMPSSRATPSRRAGPAQTVAAQRAARFVATHKPPPTHKPAAPAAPRPTAQRTTPARRPRPAPVSSRMGTPGARGPASAEAQTVGVLVGLLLAAVLPVEAYLGVARLALASGHVLLGFGIALDAAARALGVIAAERAGEQRWAWACAIGGSPVVAVFALFQRSGPVSTEPAPLAGLVAILVCLAVALALAGALVGI
jgi:hypothetical protein